MVTFDDWFLLLWREPLKFGDLKQPCRKLCHLNNLFLCHILGQQCWNSGLPN